jgi:hypothetical protein
MFKFSARSPRMRPGSIQLSCYCIVALVQGRHHAYSRVKQITWEAIACSSSPPITLGMSSTVAVDQLVCTIAIVQGSITRIDFYANL